MPDDEVRQQVYRKAQMLFRSTIHDPLVQRAGQIAEPIPVVNTHNAIVSWFVGIVVAERLAGFMQFQPDLTLMRYSSFQQQPGSVEGAPFASAWLDPQAVTERAATKATADETLSSPRLTYDANPTRLVWAVTATTPAGHTRTLYVAGDYVYSA